MTTQPVLVLELFNAQVQYTVPRWQRRYRWGKPDIERLVEDLKTVAGKPIDNRHYTGTILTFPEPDQTRIVKRLRLVDGQQRLTTISILLATIAEALGSEGEIGPWTAETIRNDRLLNVGKPAKLRRKLRLQNGDEEEYRNELAVDLTVRRTCIGSSGKQWGCAAQRSARTGPSGWRGVSVRFLQSAMRSSASSTI